MVVMFTRPFTKIVKFITLGCTVQAPGVGQICNNNLHFRLLLQNYSTDGNQIWYAASVLKGESKLWIVWSTRAGGWGKNHENGCHIKKSSPVRDILETNAMHGCNVYKTLYQIVKFITLGCTVQAPDVGYICNRAKAMKIHVIFKNLLL